MSRKGQGILYLGGFLVILFLSTSCWLSLYVGEVKPDGHIILRLRGSLIDQIASPGNADRQPLHLHATSDEFGNNVALKEHMPKGQASRNVSLPRKASILEYASTANKSASNPAMTASSAANAVADTGDNASKDDKNVSIAKRDLASVKQGALNDRVGMTAHVNSTQKVRVLSNEGQSSERDYSSVTVRIVNQFTECDSHVFLPIPASTTWSPIRSSIHDDLQRNSSSILRETDAYSSLSLTEADTQHDAPPLGFDDFVRAYLHGRLAETQFDGLKVQQGGATWTYILKRLLLLGPLAAEVPRINTYEVLSFTVIVFCCLNSVENALASFAVAAHSRASVLAVHACRLSPDLSAMATARDILGLDNLLFIVTAGKSKSNRRETDFGLFTSLPLHRRRNGLYRHQVRFENVDKRNSQPRHLAQDEIADDDDEGSRAWNTIPVRGGGVRNRAHHHQEHVACDALLLLPICIQVLLDHFLPREVELLLSSAISQCQTSALIFEGQWGYKDIWSTANELVGIVLSSAPELRSDVHNFSTLIDKDQFSMPHVRRRVFSYQASGDTTLEVVGVTEEVPRELLSHGFSVRALQAQYSLSDREAGYMVASGLDRGSNLDCSLSGQKVLRFVDGSLSGCDVRPSSCDQPRYRVRIDQYSKESPWVSTPIFSDWYMNLSSKDISTHNPLMTSPKLEPTPSSGGSQNVRTSKLTSGSTLSVDDIRVAELEPESYKGTSEPTLLHSSISLSSINKNELTLLSMRESGAVAKWWRAMASYVRPLFTALVIGDNLGMVSIKLARKSPLSTFVSRRFTRHGSVERLAQVLGVSNLVTALDNDSNFLNLGEDTGRFTYVLLGAPSVVRYLSNCLLEDWEKRVGTTLSAASVCAWVEIPRLQLMYGIFAQVAPDCAIKLDYLYEGDEVRFLKRALQIAGETRPASIDILNAPDHRFHQELAEHDPAAPKLASVPNELPADEPLLIRVCFADVVVEPAQNHVEASKNTKTTFDLMSGSVLLQSLLNLEVRPAWKAKILRSHLQSLAVWHLAAQDAHVLRRDHLRYGPYADPYPQKTSQFPNDSSNLEPWRSAKLQLLCPSSDGVLHSVSQPPLSRNETLWQALRSHLRESPAEGRNGHFSLFEWGGASTSIATAVAEEFPNSTVVAIAGDVSQGLGNTAAHGNIVYCAGVKIDHRLATHMYESPEFARYSVINLEQFTPSQSRRNLRHLVLEKSQENKLDLNREPNLASTTSLLDLALTEDMHGTRELIGTLASTALTSFIPMPSGTHVSLAMHTLFGSAMAGALPPYVHVPRPAAPTLARHTYGEEMQHPRTGFVDFEARLFELLTVQPPNLSLGLRQAQSALSVRGSESVSESIVSFSTGILGSRFAPWPLARVDVINLTRPVHHHFDWARDGHKRTYTLRVAVNDSCISPDIQRYDLLRGSILREWNSNNDSATGGGVVKLHTQYAERTLSLPSGHHVSNGRVLHVYLTRDEDGSYIPYGRIRSITVIAAIRLGLIRSQRRRAFAAFLQLPLYEDMAPWNIAFTAGKLEYIDYDTRGETYDAHVARVYRVLSVLMNYKRTVQDFGMCGLKAKTAYGFSYVSECVQPGSFQGTCERDTSRPVPCDDGRCHSDYISCLRAVSTLHDAQAREKLYRRGTYKPGHASEARDSRHPARHSVSESLRQEAHTGDHVVSLTREGRSGIK
mmetsp:Transcript_10162/g.30772  ORF Transcript_10162/g.30772 Transcript_10162/m.30772 type:complete len:1687 (-) Transcript_10162:90-5150(-)